MSKHLLDNHSLTSCNREKKRFYHTANFPDFLSPLNIDSDLRWGRGDCQRQGANERVSGTVMVFGEYVLDQ
jgi:hypothetical protein